MGRITHGYGLDHAYKFFKKKYAKTKVTRETYRKICCDFNKMIVADAIEGKTVPLPYSMGSLWIKKYEIDYDNPPIDLNESRKAGKKVYHLNFHSDGYIAKWAWTKRNNLITNLIYYSFRVTREHSRAVAQIMKQPNGHKRYFS